jgi:tetratricopeptide (TPR) repeat protein
VDIDAKLLFRRGTVNVFLHNYDEAIEDLQRAMILNPNDNGIQAKLKEAKRLNELKRKREMKVYSKMFAGDDK